MAQIINRGPNKYLIRVYLGRDAAGHQSYHNETFRGSAEHVEEPALLKPNATKELSSKLPLQPSRLISKRGSKPSRATSLPEHITTTACISNAI